MLHPLMPFITEELWNAMGERPYELIVAKWPEPEAQVDPHAKAEMEWLIRLVSEVRSARTELNVPPSAKLHLFSDECRMRPRRGSTASMARCRGWPGWNRSSCRRSVARARRRSWSTKRPSRLPFEGVIDVEAEKSRLDKAAAAAEKERDSLAQRLANPNFTERAKPEAVEKARGDHDAKAAEADRLRAALERLG